MMHVGKAERSARYRIALAGVAAQLRSDRGYSRIDAGMLARQLIDPQASCAVCGVTNATLAELHERGGAGGDQPFLSGPATMNRRLTVDRIDQWGPHELANTRLACWPCNKLRGAAIRSDDVVASQVRAWWRANAPADLIGWLECPAPAAAPRTVDIAAAF